MRERNVRKKCKLNNKGMSLIEVMVAVIILALVTGPLLHSFVTAAKFNVRSKERQRVTSAAQSIMEGFKAYNLEQICYQFKNLSTFNMYSGIDFSVGSVWEEESEHRDENGNLVTSTSVREESGKFIFTPTTSNTYTFCLKNIKFENTFYDAKITVSPNAGASSTASVAAPPEMNAYLDAVYKQPSNYDKNAYKDILDNVLAELKSREKYYTYDTVSQLQTDKIKINKTTNINITKDLTNADINKVTIETVYDYSVSNYPYNKSDGSLDTFDKTFTSLSSLFVMYDNSATVSNGAKLENIYVFYYPAYNSSDTGVRINSETININNNTGVEKKVYLIKQVNGYLTPGQRETCENSYTPQINNSGDSIQLYHNLNTNLANPSGTVGAVDNNVVNSHTDILPTDTKVLVYDVQISIYEQGAAASNFTAAIPLLTLDGSMNDD